jgi:hypothetical protein
LAAQRVIGFRRARGVEAVVLRAVQERDRDGHPVQVRQVGVLPGRCDRVAGPDHLRQVVERGHVRDSEHLVQRVVSGGVELLVLVKQLVDERAALTVIGGVMSW